MRGDKNLGIRLKEASKITGRVGEKQRKQTGKSSSKRREPVKSTTVDTKGE